MTDVRASAGLPDLLAENAAMAARLASRYDNGFGNQDDLRQVAMTGLLLAAIRYEPDRGPFRPYAAATISGELKKYLRSSGWSVRVPRGLQEKAAVVDRVGQSLEQELGRSPTPDEIGERTGICTEDVLDALRASQARFAGRFPTTTQTFERQEPDDPTETMVLSDLVGRLSEREQQLFQLRYVDEMSQRQIGHRLGISQSQVHRRLNDLHLVVKSQLHEVGFER